MGLATILARRVKACNSLSLMFIVIQCNIGLWLYCPVCNHNTEMDLSCVSSLSSVIGWVVVLRPTPYILGVNELHINKCCMYLSLQTVIH